MTLDEIKKALIDRNLMRVSEATDIHYQTLYAIRNGRTQSAKRRTLRVLSAYLNGEKNEG